MCPRYRFPLRFRAAHGIAGASLGADVREPCRQDMGPGVQPQPARLRRAHTAHLARGSRKPFPALNGKRPAHGPLVQRGRSPAPTRCKRAGNRGAGRRSGGPAGAANSGTKGAQRAGCPPVEAAVQRRRVGGAVLKRGRGRPARAAACRPSGQRAALPRCRDGGSVCFDRLPICDGL